ncbi:esterase [Synechococcus sp. CCY9201]|jgi:pimeloyl-ACP methyl ester carboxylesterase|uniref:lipase family alpha/beta hydrolase n=1 Tax=unclassified Synechococcus TaxID=2626047 RepID=UPI0018CDC4F8|nr:MULTISPECIES: esterase [unclassified Synechococcus]MEA5474228.1 esterase [Synechococcus sp. CCY9201]QPN61867.1 esterase [Synechococcus sp. CBW1002]
MTQQPIVILGGFLITAEAYEPLRLWLQDQTSQPVLLVPASRFDWLLTSFPFGWVRLLDRVAVLVAEQAARSSTGRVTLIGHSSGGVMLRLFLADQPFEGRTYNGKARADTLVMLGSPHTARRATPLRQRVDRELPGCPFADQVRYVSVAGDLPPAAFSPTARRLAPSSYRNICGDADAPGDGLVPVTSALLAGSEAITLAGVAHGGAFGPRWYGTPEVAAQWWPAVVAGLGEGAGPGNGCPD